MNTRELTCIGCPLGCTLLARWEDAAQIEVSGNACPNGAAYAQKELTNPRRTVTSTARVSDAAQPCVSVKTQTDIPKERIFDCVREIKQLRLHAPVHIGEVLIENVCDTGVRVVATQELAEVV